VTPDGKINDITYLELRRGITRKDSKKGSKTSKEIRKKKGKKNKERIPNASKMEICNNEQQINFPKTRLQND
jgi:hypothetical protein